MCWHAAQPAGHSHCRGEEICDQLINSMQTYTHTHTRTHTHTHKDRQEGGVTEAAQMKMEVQKVLDSG